MGFITIQTQGEDVLFFFPFRIEDSQIPMRFGLDSMFFFCFPWGKSVVFFLEVFLWEKKGSWCSFLGDFFSEASGIFLAKSHRGFGRLVFFFLRWFFE